jgi:hypothetical protein
VFLLELTISVNDFKRLKTGAFSPLILVKMHYNGHTTIKKTMTKGRWRRGQGGREREKQLICSL